jgi:outer membrane protein TolC
MPIVSPSRLASRLLVFCLLVAAAESRANPLQEFLDAKLRSNADVVAAEQNLRSAEAARDLTASNLYPTLSANWKSARSDTRDGFQKQLSLDADQTLFGGGLEYTELKSARLAVQRAEYDLADTRDRVYATYSLKLVRLIVQKEKLEILRKVKRAQDDRLKELKRRFNLGKTREPDLLQVEVESSRLDRSILDAERAIDAYEQELENLLLLQEADMTALNGLLNPQGVRLLIVGLKNRPEYRSASLKLLGDALAQQERSAWLGVMPTLGLYGQANLVRPSTLSNDWEWGLQAKWTFFEGFRTPAQVEAIKAQRIVAENRLFAFEHAKKLNLERLDREMQRAEMKKTSIEADIKRAERALAQQQKDYRLGLVSELEVQQSLQSSLDLDLELIAIQETRALLKLQEFLGGEQPL